MSLHPAIEFFRNPIPVWNIAKIDKGTFKLFNTDDCNDLTWRCCCYPCMSFFESNVGRDVICLEILNTSKRVVQRPCTSRWIIQSHLPLRTTIELQKSCVYHPLVPPVRKIYHMRGQWGRFDCGTLFSSPRLCVYRTEDKLELHEFFSRGNVEHFVQFFCLKFRQLCSKNNIRLAQRKSITSSSHDLYAGIQQHRVHKIT